MIHSFFVSYDYHPSPHSPPQTSSTAPLHLTFPPPGLYASVTTCADYRKNEPEGLGMRLLSFIIILTLLSGCSSKEYYQALTAQYNAVQRTTAQPVQLVNHTWTEADGTSHALIVNQPACGNQRLELPHIPASGEIGFKYFDRVLGILERALPWLAFLTGGGGRSDSSTTYQMGDHSAVVTTKGDSSPIDYQVPFAPPEEPELPEVPTE